MAWVFLLLAGVAEIAWAIGLKFTDGFSRPVPSLFTAIAIGASLLLLSLALREIPMGTAYAVWTGIGVIGTVVAGMLLFDESASPARLLCIALIVVGIVGLKLLTPDPSP